MPKWISDSIAKLWDGFLNHIGIIVAAFLFSGGYLVAINKLKEFQTWIRSIPTDYILTPLVLLLVVLAVVVRINLTQKRRLKLLETSPPDDDAESVFVTHYGVWWKMYPEEEYIEDFPYCPCCEPKQKLVQIEWHPDELFKCPKTQTEIKLFDKIPWEKETVLENLYRSYFRGGQLEMTMFQEFNRIKKLCPDKETKDIMREVFEMEPLDRIPKEKANEIIDRFDSHGEMIHFFTSNFRSYRKYIKRNA